MEIELGNAEPLLDSGSIQLCLPVERMAGANSEPHPLVVRN